jgi:hypothetical protein
MLPVYLGKAEVEKNETHNFRTSGDCFRTIKISTTFHYENPGKGKQVGSVKAEVVFDLQDPYSSVCMEHFVIGTPF